MSDWDSPKLSMLFWSMPSLEAISTLAIAAIECMAPDSFKVFKVIEWNDSMESE